MIILVEGIDKSGKTTFINTLKTHIPSTRIFKNAIKPGKGDVEIGRIAGVYQGAYQFANMIKDKNFIVFDRSHITEIVYSYLRGYESSEKIDWRKIEGELLKDAVIVYNYAPPSIISQRFKTDKEDYVREEEILNIITRYEAYLESTKIPYVTISSLDSVDSNLAKVVTFISKQEK